MARSGRIIKLFILLLVISSAVNAGERKCTKFLTGGPLGFRVYNSCDECLTVVIDHIGGKQPITVEYDVPGHAAVDVKREAPTMSIIDEFPCKGAPRSGRQPR